MHLGNPNLPLIEPYTPGLSREYVASRYGIPPERIAKLGSAENPFGPTPCRALYYCNACRNPFEQFKPV